MAVADESGTSGAYQDVPVRPFELRGTVLLFSTLVCALFHTDATHSFISRVLVSSMGLKMEELGYPLVVSNSVSGRTRLRYVCPSCVVYLGEQVDLRFHCLDWLTSYSARLDCENRRIVLQGEDGNLIHVQCDRGNKKLD